MQIYEIIPRMRHMIFEETNIVEVVNGFQHPPPHKTPRLPCWAQTIHAHIRPFNIGQHRIRGVIMEALNNYDYLHPSH